MNEKAAKYIFGELITYKRSVRSAKTIGFMAVLTAAYLAHQYRKHEKRIDSLEDEIRELRNKKGD